MRAAIFLCVWILFKAAEYAKSIGTPILAMTGYSGGKLKAMCDFSMHADINDMQITEDIHMMFDHMLMRIFCLSQQKSM